MANLITLKSFTDFNDQNFSPSKEVTINTGLIVRVDDASTAQKEAFPGVNSAVTVNYKQNNIQYNGELLVNEAVSAIVSAANT